MINFKFSKNSLKIGNSQIRKSHTWFCVQWEENSWEVWDNLRQSDRSSGVWQFLLLLGPMLTKEERQKWLKFKFLQFKKSHFYLDHWEEFRSLKFSAAIGRRSILKFLLPYGSYFDNKGPGTLTLCLVTCQIGTS